MLRTAREHLERLVRQPVSELRGWQRSLRYFIDLVRHCAKRLSEDRAEEMAAALTYRTIFSLIPLVVLGLVVFRMFGGIDEVVQNQVQPRLYEFFGVPDITYGDEEEPVAEPLAAAGSGEEAAEAEARKPGEAPGAGDQRHVRASIQKALTELASKVAKVDFTSIGFIGAILFIYAGMALAVSVEYDFNIICESPRGRPWHLRIAIYWSVITLGTGLLAASLYFAGEAVRRVGGLSDFSLLQPLLSRAVAFAASWVLLFLMYVAMPNTKVHWRVAMVGSFVAAVMWETGKALFQVYVRQAVPYSALYGSLGLVPVFLFWIYTSWWIVLFGLELAYTLQVMPGRVPTRPDEKLAPPLPADSDWLIPFLAEVGRFFVQGQTVGRQQLAERLGLPSRIVNEFAVQLEKHGIIHAMESGSSDVTYSLAIPPNRIRVADILALGRQLSRSASSGGAEKAALTDWEFVDRLFQAQCTAASGTTLEDLIEQLERKHHHVTAPENPRTEKAT
jgi:membrane protein